MRRIRIGIVLLAVVLLITTLFSISTVGECEHLESSTRADENAPIYILLDIPKAARDQEITPSETVTYEIIVRNLNSTTTIDYFPPSASSIILPVDWGITFKPSDKLTIQGNSFGYLDVSLTAPIDAKANTEVQFELEGSTSHQEAIIIPIELSARVSQIYDISFSSIDKITFASPTNPKNLKISIVNDGNGDDRVALEIAGIPTGLNLSQEAQEFFIGPNGKVNITINLIPSSILTAGVYDLNISLYRVKTAAREWVSSQKLAVEVVYYPDLEVSAGDIELSKYTPYNEEDITINVTIHNIGDTDARDITVKVIKVTKHGSQQTIKDIVIDFLGLGKSVIKSVPWQADAAVDTIIVRIDPDNSIGELEEGNNEAQYHIHVILPSIPPGGGQDVGEYTASQMYAVAIIAILAGITISVGASFLTTEYGKIGMFKLLLPLYTRVKREEVLNHEVRELVYDYVQTHPGEHYRAILAKLGLTNGTLIHHLHTLERQRFIKSERDGPFKRFYPTGRQLTEDVLEINGIQKKILDTISINPGITQKDLAIQLKTSPPTINYHIKALHGVRLVDIKREGKNTHIFPGQSLNGWFKSGKVS